MDFVNRALAQITDLFASMTPAARITTGLLLAVVVTSLAFLFNSEFSAGDAYLMGGRPFQADEISQAEAAFGQAGLNGYEVEGNRILVPRGLQSTYMAALVEADAMPADFGDFLWKAANDASPFASGKQIELRNKAARERDLSNIIGEMHGIKKAAVTYDTAEKSGLRRTPIRTATVWVQPDGSQDLAPATANSIRKLVAGSIAGLKKEDVTVGDLNSSRTYGGPPSESGHSGHEDVYLAKTQGFREEIENRINNAVAYIPGVIVTANVELNNELDHQKSVVTYDPKKKVSVFSETENSSSSESRPVPFGQPGLAAQQTAAGNSPAVVGAGTAPAAQNEESAESTREQSLPSTDTEQIKFAGLTPKLATVSVKIPKSYFVTVWQEQNPPAEGDEPATPSPADLNTIQTEVEQDVRTHVAKLIQSDAGQIDPTSLVTVSSFTDIRAEPIPEPGITSEAGAWLATNWTTVGLFALAGVSLLVLRSTIRSQPSGPEPRLPEVALAETPNETENETAPPRKSEPRLKRHSGDEGSLRDELTELVREDPDAAASVLRSWIAKAG